MACRSETLPRGQGRPQRSRCSRGSCHCHLGAHGLQHQPGSPSACLRSWRGQGQHTVSPARPQLPWARHSTRAAVQSPSKPAIRPSPFLEPFSICHVSPQGACLHCGFSLEKETVTIPVHERGFTMNWGNGHSLSRLRAPTSSLMSTASHTPLVIGKVASSHQATPNPEQSVFNAF